jgi:hypothetical protein
LMLEEKPCPIFINGYFHFLMFNASLSGERRLHLT